RSFNQARKGLGKCAPALRHRAERLLAARGEAIVSTRRPGRRILDPDREQPSSCKPQKDRVNRALGELQSGERAQLFDDALPERLPLRDAGEYGQFDHSLAELCLPATHAVSRLPANRYYALQSSVPVRSVNCGMPARPPVARP